MYQYRGLSLIRQVKGSLKNQPTCTLTYIDRNFAKPRNPKPEVFLADTADCTGVRDGSSERMAKIWLPSPRSCCVHPGRPPLHGAPARGRHVSHAVWHRGAEHCKGGFWRPSCLTLIMLSCLLLAKVAQFLNPTQRLTVCSWTPRLPLHSPLLPVPFPREQRQDSRQF